MLKTYRIYREKSKSVTVSVDGKIVVPNFQQVGLFKEFSTRDEKLQSALEKDIRFKSVYFLVYTEEKTVTSYELQVTEDEEIKSTNNQIIKSATNQQPEEVTDITTTQAAKAFLRAKGIGIANSASKEKVIEIAENRGFLFPNLKRETASP